jgi:hypothetical protein
MKKLFLTLVALGTLAAFSAHAEVNKPVWDCALTFTAKGGGVQVIVGKFQLSGPGNIRCVDVAGNTQVLPVRVIMGGSWLAPSVGAGYLHLAGVASGIGVAHGPQALLGRYVVAGAQVGIIVGAGANFSVHGGNEAVTLNLGVNVTRGLGAQVGITGVRILAANGMGEMAPSELE